MSAARGVAAMFLRRAGLFSLVLALIAGIFGMHVINGHHIMHGPAIAIGAAESVGLSHPAGEAAHGVTADPVHADAGDEISAEAGCPDGDCSGTRAMTVSCIPSGKTDTLSAPMPATAMVGVALLRAAPAGQVSQRTAYSPDARSPCELSISRT